jgi:P pilus assembly chaperone PapD
MIRAVALSVVIGVALFIEAAPTPADAAQFDVTPVEAILSVHNRSQLLTIQNNSSETMRLQLSAFGWRDGANGEPVLSPTDEIIFSPSYSASCRANRAKYASDHSSPLGRRRKPTGCIFRN